MKKENVSLSGNGGNREPTVRMTRARVAASRFSAGVLPPKPPSTKPEPKRALSTNSKRAAMDANGHPIPFSASVKHKRRAVLTDITNCHSSYQNCINAAKMQIKDSKKAKLAPGKKDSNVTPAVAVEAAQVQDDTKDKIAEEIRKTGISESQETRFLISAEAEGKMVSEQCVLSATKEENRMTAYPDTNVLIETQRFIKPSEFVCRHLKNDKENLCKDGTGSSNWLNYMDIDSDHKNPQLCSLYAPEIYMNLSVAELHYRPCSTYMENFQSDITQSMRGILVDWLVEVAEEYKLVPDTLYLTINFIDRFLSQNYIERQKLQLLGVTCMLIASKYEEICAPRVEEFCIITDNTYTRVELLKMESRVLNHLGFQLSAPTTKSFLRRFLRAAQVSYKVPVVELEFLANYLAELTLVDYEFLKFRPSLVAASAVFLARWTLDQLCHPWNLTLEHYTSYKALALKDTVFAMQELQINSKGCPLSAIREKYRQLKFNHVAALSSPKLLETLFSDDQHSGF